MNNQIVRTYTDSINGSRVLRLRRGAFNHEPSPLELLDDSLKQLLRKRQDHGAVLQPLYQDRHVY